MAKVFCRAVGTEEGITTRGQASIEWYEDGKPQYYCRGYVDASTEEPLKSCKNCQDFLGGTKIEIDFKKFKDLIE